MQRLIWRIAVLLLMELPCGRYVSALPLIVFARRPRSEIMRKRSIVPATFIALSLAASSLWTAPTAIARLPYDGKWSVLIVTDAGTCDRAYRYALDIANGRITTRPVLRRVRTRRRARSRHRHRQRRRRARERHRATVQRRWPRPVERLFLDIGMLGPLGSGTPRLSACRQTRFLFAIPLSLRKPDQRKMPERRHRPPLDDAHAAVPRRPSRRAAPSRIPAASRAAAPAARTIVRKPRASRSRAPR